MENNHLTYFKVENFKKFDALEVNDIGQFNLIVGDNNVGKTCLLEALLVDEDIDLTIKRLHNSLCRRNIHIHPTNINSNNPIFPFQNYFDFIKTNKDNKLVFNFSTKESQIEFSFEDKNINDLNEVDFEKEKNHNFLVGRPSNWIKIFKDKIFVELQFMYLDDFKTKFSHGYIPFISKNAGFNYDINKYYAEEIGLSEIERVSTKSLNDITSSLKSLSFEDKQNFIKQLLLFFEDIEDIAIKEYFERDMLSVKLKRYDDYVPITYFGDGTNEYVRYLLEILKCKSKRIMIDEIDTGIHHTKLKDFWVNILKVCKQLKVQLFATTHSKECIEAYIEASNEIDEKSVRLIRLQENKDKSIKAICYKEEYIEYMVESNTEER